MAVFGHLPKQPANRSTFTQLVCTPLLIFHEELIGSVLAVTLLPGIQARDVHSMRAKHVLSRRTPNGKQQHTSMLSARFTPNGALANARSTQVYRMREHVPELHLARGVFNTPRAAHHVL